MAKLNITQCGQPRPYADSIYEGTVEAAHEREAREALQKMRYRIKPIYDKQDKKDWAHPYFVYFKEISPHLWAFKIIEAYTG